ncbi:hypothetical protein RBSWK_00137 [Rhodopirellula baltica SWK14]|uniref:Uncharacterized protein n=1 Tax=Rhodopirellula baltica SWK14 TaxID=993516 RepID=L7CNQ2_RHOBT|nr:hypothetical protein RBSWK_00137 [Rhodopirellula baltica SWK14]
MESIVPPSYMQPITADKHIRSPLGPPAGIHNQTQQAFTSINAQLQHGGLHREYA